MDAVPAADATPERIVVVGGGLAAAQTCVALRERGHRGPLTLVGAEARPPYDRPPLSKAVLAGETDDPVLEVAWRQLDVELLLGRRATGLRDGVVDTDAGPLDFDRLVVATGADPVTLPGAETHVLRTLDDALRLRAALQPGARVVVVGAGWIGAEVTTAARSRGCAVTVVEAAGAPLARALGCEMGAATARWYADSGADLRVGVRVAAVEEGAVHLGDGSELPADVVVVGIGVRPADGWLAGSGLAVDTGVLVDDHLRASDPRVFAAGDVAAWHSRRFGTRLRLEHWDDALRAPEVVAANLLGGDQVHDPVPYFWSEQFGRTVQVMGYPGGADRVVWRGSPDEPGWAACWLAGRRLEAVVAVDRPRDAVQARRLIAAGAEPDLGRLSDPAVPLKSAA